MKVFNLKYLFGAHGNNRISLEFKKRTIKHKFLFKKYRYKLGILEVRQFQIIPSKRKSFLFSLEVLIIYCSDKNFK